MLTYAIVGFELMGSKGSGSGSVGRVFASNTREMQTGAKLYLIITVEKTTVKKKRPGFELLKQRSIIRTEKSHKNYIKFFFEVEQLLHHCLVLFRVDHENSAALLDEVAHLALQLLMSALNSAQKLI